MTPNNRDSFFYVTASWWGCALILLALARPDVVTAQASPPPPILVRSAVVNDGSNLLLRAFVCRQVGCAEVRPMANARVQVSDGERIDEIGQTDATGSIVTPVSFIRPSTFVVVGNIIAGPEDNQAMRAAAQEARVRRGVRREAIGAAQREAQQNAEESQRRATAAAEAEAERQRIQEQRLAREQAQQEARDRECSGQQTDLAQALARVARVLARASLNPRALRNAGMMFALTGVGFRQNGNLHDALALLQSGDEAVAVRVVHSLRRMGGTRDGGVQILISSSADWGALMSVDVGRLLIDCTPAPETVAEEELDLDGYLERQRQR